jgi:hypothetical protein
MELSGRISEEGKALRNSEKWQRDIFNLIETYTMRFTPDELFLMLFASSILHQFEEFVYPGGFAMQFREMTLKVGIKITNNWLFVTNILFLGVIILALFFGNPFFRLGVISIVLINCLLHIGKSLHLRGYFPGLITSLLLYLPIAIFAFTGSELSISQKIFCFFGGLLMHAFPFLLVPVFKK